MEVSQDQGFRDGNVMVEGPSAQRSASVGQVIDSSPSQNSD